MDKESIFAQALTKHAPGELYEFLQTACSGDAGLRAEIEELLAAHHGAGSFLEQTPAEFRAAVATGKSPRSTDAWRRLLRPSEREDSLGKLGPYEVTGMIGQGGMGVVLRAHDPQLNRVVAIKLLSPELAANAVSVRRFLREARAAAAVSHNHVVTIYAIDENTQPPILVMEYIDGPSLQQTIDTRGPLDVKTVLRIGMQVASGLAAAHRQGLVHRDIKPANILLENGVDRVKLTDFGLARAVDDIAVTQTGQIAGTPQYMSPEQALGRKIDHRTDLFSLGCVLYTMCTGQAAFQADSAVAVMHRVVHDAPRAIRQLNEDIPDWLCGIVDKLLCKNPDERWQSAEEVEDLLGRHLAYLQRPGTAPLPPPVVPPSAAADSPATAQQVGKPVPARAADRGLIEVVLALLVFVVMVMAAIIAAAVWYTMSSGREGDRGVIRLPRDGSAAAERGESFVILARNWGAQVQREPVRCLAVSPTGAWVASGHQVGDGDGVSLWDGRSSGAERTNLAANAEVRDIGYSPDATQLAWVQANGQLRLVPVDASPERTPRKFTPAKEPLNCLAWSPDGSRILAGGPTRLHVWDVQRSGEFFGVTLETEALAGVPPAIVELAYANNGRRVATGHADGRILIWRADPAPSVIRQLRDTSREPFNRAHRLAVSGLVFSRDGSRLYSCGHGGLVHEWNVLSGKLISTNLTANRNPIRALALAPDGTRWAAAGFRQPAGSISLLNRQPRQEIRFPLKGSHTDNVTCMAFTADGKYLISGGEDGLIKWWKFSQPLAAAEK